MSDVIVAALISGALVVLGSVGATVANLAFNYKAEKARLGARACERAAERSEWYRRALFERRLEAVQRAHVWLLDLNRAVSIVLAGAEPDSDEASELRRIATDARSWYDENVLYLYDELPSASPFVGLTNVALEVAGGRGVSAIWRMHQEASDEIRARAVELLTSHESGD